MWMTAIAMSGTSIALFISSSVKTERAALSAVPLVLVPQLLLAGTPLIPFEEMNRGLFSGAQESRKEGKEPVLSRIIPLRYAYEGITVDQATNNLFEKTRRSINDRAQALKDKKSFNMTYLNEGLSEIDSERLNVLLRALTKLYSIQATTEAEAKELILRIESRAITGSEKDIKSIKSKGDEKKLQPCHLFFVNQRAEQLVQKQDIQRVDLTKEQNRNIFLAEKKYFGQEDNPKYKELVAQLNSTQITKLNKDLVPSKKIPRSWSTSKLCFAIILSLSVFLLLLSTFIVARSNKRTTE